ncbi:rhodanese-like domain-containing protein [Mangrovibacterium lignilyticum]|uniref:rhodanese-like domain-containing protein n=1 Tax=Mangrovibacterium lignilyticum TaxID=2668052 RepID=UPI0013D6C445|nr:rhodanese-like domain-containing protein [Mangrovibacterium lignilyticum]
MDRNYIYLTILMLVLAIGTLLVNNEPKLKQIEPQQLLLEMVQPTRYVTTDQIAKMIIHGDPSLELVDVRSADEFEQFALPRSVNIPLDSLINSSSLGYFGIPGTKVVFVSNDDIAADQAWVLTKRLGFKGTYVMRGGLNCWMETIINPQEPSEGSPNTAYETYAFRKGAQQYFTGAKAEVAEGSKVKVEVQRRKKTSAVAGGC